MMKRVTYNGLTFEPYISREEISARIKEMAKEITRDCHGTVPLFLCVLNGAFLFASDLFREIDISAEISFIRLKSYEGTGSTGTVKELLYFNDDITNRTVVIVEDIVDTGKTIEKLVCNLKQKHPANIKIATLLFKPESLQCDIHPDYVGFEIPPKYVIGFGLDLDGLARNLPDIYTLCENS